MTDLMKKADAAFEREFGPKLHPEIAPPAGLQSNNTDIQASESAIYTHEAEDGICALSDEEMAEGDLTEIRR